MQAPAGWIALSRTLDDGVQRGREGEGERARAPPNAGVRRSRMQLDGHRAAQLVPAPPRWNQRLSEAPPPPYPCGIPHVQGFQ